MLPTMTIQNAPSSPHALFQLWLKEAIEQELNDPTAACLATVDETGQPNARMVLVRIIDDNGFVFFTNSTSRKGSELIGQKQAALCFHWKSLRKQVRVQGAVVPSTDAESDDYYNSRHRSSRIGAWASLQSQTLPSREILMERFAGFEARFAEQENPPRPPHWHGFRILPTRVEFWKEGEYRLHDRLAYTKNGANWETSLLYP